MKSTDTAWEPSGGAVRLRRALPEGMCVAVVPPAETDAGALRAALPRAERACVGTDPSPRRLLAWTAGRAALRAAVAGLGVRVRAIPRAPWGGPLLPPGLSGSISHKPGLAVALATAHPGAYVGVDVERVRPGVRLPPALLSDAERGAGDGGAPAGLAMLLRFCLKEAAYKAMYPVVLRYVDFPEVSVLFDAAGGVRLVPGPALPRELRLEGGWHRCGDHVVARVRATFGGVRERGWRG